MSQHFDDLAGVETDIDDILFHGTTEEEHDRRLESVLERFEKINLTIKKRNVSSSQERSHRSDTS